MNSGNGTLTMFVSVMRMLAIGYASMADDRNKRKKKSTYYTLLVMFAMMVIAFLVGSFPIH